MTLIVVVFRRAGKVSLQQRHHLLGIARPGGGTVIERGLQSGESVVIDGQLRLAPGAKVEVKAPTENPAQPATGSAQ